MYIKVRVVAGANAEKTVQKDENTWEIWVREKAERNLANARVAGILAEIYKTKNVRLISGHHSRSKIFNIGE